VSAARKAVAEDIQQGYLFDWARVTRLPAAADVLPGAKVADYLYHIPNGGHRDPRVAKKLKRQGVKAGVSDLHLPLARHGFLGLWIELKTEGGRLQDSQRDWLDRMNQAGHMAVVCVGWRAAVDTVASYVQESGLAQG
jgi:hypothetical protein